MPVTGTGAMSNTFSIPPKAPRLRLVKRFGFDLAAPIVTAKLYRDSVAGGYLVRFFKDGRHRSLLDFKGPSLADARSAAQAAIDTSRAAPAAG